MAVVDSSLKTDLEARKALGRAHLNANRVEDALRVYARILRDYPDDLDSYLFLGDCYLADGDGATAHLFYSQAHQLDANNSEVMRRFRLLQADYNLAEFSGLLPLPSDSQTIAELLQRLTGRLAPVTEAEVHQAAILLKGIINSPHPAQAVSEYLDQIDTLLPALLELNIRQAQADGRPDLASALQDLLNNIHLQLENQLNVPLDSAGVGQEGFTGEASRQPAAVTPRVLYLRPEAESQSAHPGALAEALDRQGCRTTLASKLEAGQIDQFDVLILRHPHTDSKLMEALAAGAAAKKPVFLELDADFESMPVDHPDYDVLGLGTPTRAKAYATALLLADTICVPCETLAASLRAVGHTVHVIPEGWTDRNTLWEKPANPRHTVNLGWMSPPGEIEEVNQIRRVIIRVMREFPQVRLVISGDAQVYQLFDSLPEARRLYLPPVSAEDYPYLLGQVDILMVPLHNTPYNCSLCDRRLMEAGARGIPWVASPIPSHIDWNDGGLIAATADEWHTYLRQLVLDPNLRVSLGLAGRKKTESRKIDYLAKTWFDLFVSCMQPVE